MLRLERPSWDVMAAELEGVLGKQGAKDFIDYDNALGVMPMAEDFARRCDAAGVPIPDKVVDQIALTILKLQTQNPVGNVDPGQTDLQ